MTAAAGATPGQRERDPCVWYECEACGSLVMRCPGDYPGCWDCGAVLMDAMLLGSQDAPQPRGDEKEA